MWEAFMRDDGIKYEEYCCKYLQERGYTTQTTVASGDQGADIIAEKDGIRIAVQCKYRTEGSVGNDAIQQALAGKLYYDCDLALVITNVDFTSQALSAAKKLKVKTWSKIKMIESNKNHNDKGSVVYQEKTEDVYVIRTRETVEPFISGVIGTFCDIDDKVGLGKTLMNQRFEPYYNSMDLDFGSEEIRLKDYEKQYLVGRQHGLNLLEMINDISPIKFRLIDWSCVYKRDKNIYVFETSEIINAYFRSELQNELNRLFSLEVTVECPTRHSLIVSVINKDKNKTDDVRTLISFISKRINETTSRSVISLDTQKPLLEYKQIESEDVQISEEENLEDYSAFYLFTCREYIADNTLSLIEKESRELFKQRIKIRKKDSHSFVLFIRKYIGLNDHLTLIDLHSFRGNNFSELMSITTGICSEELVFTVKLKNVDITKYDGKINNHRNRAAVTVCIEQVRFYIMGLFDQIMIDMIKNKKIDIPTYIINNRYWSEGLEVNDVFVRVVDANNRIIFLESTYTKKENAKTFPINNMKHESFYGSTEGCSTDFIGINTMMIQKLLQDKPLLTELLGGYYVIDTLKQKIADYFSVLDDYPGLFLYACRKMELCIVEDDKLIYGYEDDEAEDNGDNPESYVPFLYNIQREEKDSFRKNEYDSAAFGRRNAYFWMVTKNVPVRNYIWGKPFIPINSKSALAVKQVIEKCLSEHKIRVIPRKIEFPIRNSFYYEIPKGANLSPALTQINATLPESSDSSEGGLVHGYLREYNECVFIWHKYIFGKYWYVNAYKPLEELEGSTKGKPLSFWFIDSGLSSVCKFESYCGKGKQDNLALLIVRLKKVSIRDLELEMTEKSHNLNRLWGAWNDLIFALLSLMKLCRVSAPKRMNLLIDVYDDNGMTIAELSDNNVLYSYLQYYEEDIINHRSFGFSFGIEDVKSVKILEDYKQDVVPIINDTLKQSIITLGELSEEN